VAQLSLNPFSFLLLICHHCFRRRLAYQPPVSSTFLSEQTSHQQPANNTFLSQQISTSHQAPAKRTVLEKR
jgi:hypothetical protein